jgi:ribosome maturation factor RimP
VAGIAAVFRPARRVESTDSKPRFRGFVVSGGKVLAVTRPALEGRIAPLVAGLGCELLGVETRSGGEHGLVRIYIDAPDGITVEDCERVSRQVSALLDVEEPMRGPYTLEVSSPGLDRPLFTPEHYRRFLGQRVKVSLVRLHEGRRHVTGLLAAADDAAVTVEDGTTRVVLPYELIARGRLVPDL